MTNNPATTARSGPISEHWGAEFAELPDGWRFMGWVPIDSTGEEAEQPRTDPEHVGLRFVTFEDGLEFFRERYGRE